MSRMITVDQVASFLDAFAPLRLAESWDNVGLLLGDRAAKAERIMTCLTITDSTADEAIAEKADLIVAHHPLPFAALKTLTTDSQDGRLLWKLAGARISIFSPHTAFDSAADGINQRLAIGIGLVDVAPLIPQAESSETLQLGAGRRGRLGKPEALSAVADRVKRFLQIDRVQLVGDPATRVNKVAIACGSGAELMADAIRQGCDCFLTGEARFHAALAAEAARVSMILAGHYATERFGVEHLAETLALAFAEAHVWASRQERDPLGWA
jgi:dinuclear metal center YbgI/SA1388 family protein